MSVSQVVSKSGGQSVRLSDLLATFVHPDQVAELSGVCFGMPRHSIVLALLFVFQSTSTHVHGSFLHFNKLY